MAMTHLGGPTLLDVLDRVLDKGIVIDAWVRASALGFDVIAIQGRIVVARMEVHLQRAGEAGAETAPA